MGRIKKQGKRHLVAIDEDIWKLLDEASSKVDQHVTQYVRELVVANVFTDGKAKMEEDAGDQF